MPRRYLSYAEQLERQRAAAARAVAAAARAAEVQLRRADKAEKLAHAERRLQEAEDQTEDVVARAAAIDSLLQVHVGKRTAVDFYKLKRVFRPPSFDAQGLDHQIPEPVLQVPPGPNVLERLIPPLMRRHEAAYEAAMREHDARRALHAKEAENRAQRLADLKEQYKVECDRLEAEVAAANKQVDEFREDYNKHVPDAVTEYFEMVLDSDILPSGFPKIARVAYVADSKQLVVERQMPSSDIVPAVTSFKYVKSGDAIEPKPRPLSQIKAMYNSLVAQFALSTVSSLYASDAASAIDVLVINCFVDTVDPATGKEIRPCLLSLRVTRDAYDALDLSKVDPTTCLRSLGARISPSAHELMAVQPVVHFDMVDPRFIDKRDVLGGLDNRPNLAELSPSDFEALMTNLFEKMGLETRLTRPSRDGGVDCVAYDPRAILGGKVVIQAKRYRNTVGVSAVRDLYGTMINEGASKGILVSTSGYGKAANDFIQNKPLELISGENLLYLLATFADVHAKIDFPQAWVDPTMDSPEPQPAEAVNAEAMPSVTVDSGN